MVIDKILKEVIVVHTCICKYNIFSSKFQIQVPQNQLKYIPLWFMGKYVKSDCHCRLDVAGITKDYFVLGARYLKYLPEDAEDIVGKSHVKEEKAIN